MKSTVKYCRESLVCPVMRDKLVNSSNQAKIFTFWEQGLRCGPTWLSFRWSTEKWSQTLQFLIFTSQKCQKGIKSATEKPFWNYWCVMASINEKSKGVQKIIIGKNKIIRLKSISQNYEDFCEFLSFYSRHLQKISLHFYHLIHVQTILAAKRRIFPFQIS